MPRIKSLFSFAATSRERFEQSSNYRYVSGAGWLRLFIAICLTFAPISIIASSHFLHPGENSWENLGIVMAYMIGCGVVAGVWAFAFVRSIRMLWWIAPAYAAVIAIAYKFNLFPRVMHFSMERVAGAIFIAAGYLFFFSYIRGEGVRGIRLRTEMSLARRIHETLVPAISKSTAFLEVLGSSSPSSEMGGDLIVLLTDGLTEAMDGEGNLFGSERLYKFIEANARLPLAELHAKIMGEIEAYGAAVDDQTLLLARVKGDSPGDPCAA